MELAICFARDGDFNVRFKAVTYAQMGFDGQISMLNK
jgi:hypothetical protein